MRDDGSEAGRLGALAGLAILDTPAEGEFDEIVRLASTLLDCPSCGISLIDEQRQWFKSRVGIEFSETPREHAFCRHPVETCDYFEVQDAASDSRFADNPLVRAPGGIRFYAGAPLMIASGHCLGSLCVFDSKVRPPLDARQRQTLLDLARTAAGLIDSRQMRQVGRVAAKVVQATSDAILCVDANEVITFWNRAAERMFGHAAADAIGKSLDLIMPRDMADAHHAGFARAAGGGPTRLIGTAVELRALRASGEEFPIELSLAPLHDGPGIGGCAAIIRDITERKSLERDHRQTREFLDTVVANLPAMLFVKDAESRRYLLLNRTGEELIGRPAAQIVGRTDAELFPNQGADYMARDDDALSGRGMPLSESDFTRDDGRVVTVRTRRIIVDGMDRPRQYILGISEDMTEARRTQAEVIQLAQFDALTGLRNRASLVKLLEQTVATGQRMALLAINLDRFKPLNDQFGHPVGDAVLAEVGRRILKVVRASDIVSRVGSDEFLIVAVDAAPVECAERIALAITRALGEPITAEDFSGCISASIGIAVAPEDGRVPDELRQSADLALHRAKSEGRGGICFYSDKMDAAARDRRDLERDLHTALDQGEIWVAYQPIVSAATGQITSAEALARWTHPSRGPIPPDVFISIAEEAGLIERLGARLLETACRDAAAWPEHIRLAVNLSPRQFEEGNLLATVERTLQACGLPASRLQLEVTEGLLIRNVDRTFKLLSELRAMGIQILMDDFGVGYSSLSYFERFPFDKVKIDRSFVQKIVHSQAARAIVQAVVHLGATLQMRVVAEGVETGEQRDLLVSAGCTHMQGYLFSRPVPNDSFRTLLEGNDAALAGDRQRRVA
ncbi:sensor domain-containing phosphodiesterase [Zavarzinia sp. CC-PAN008]|uniref:sensor domain-containing phosphodiesterase n=1 Tax=Zavarzinia sp. CC-PAN008 TaxID=3243332 RepID=UPI003F7437AE